ncbi:CLUMA_CG002823, isoform A [Clunio marinus]|uniref:CLUMA_CG002823, isoform A n=1 Tax=Clunio marinus TaxID=568069 RepID=A0A1J1HRT0_9DIPT|nr:CLUMA_CG002823, isoform A [Clunio marinus]
MEEFVHEKLTLFLIICKDVSNKVLEFYDFYVDDSWLRIYQTTFNKHPQLKKNIKTNYLEKLTAVVPTQVPKDLYGKLSFNRRQQKKENTYIRPCIIILSFFLDDEDVEENHHIAY